MSPSLFKIPNGSRYIDRSSPPFESRQSGVNGFQCVDHLPSRSFTLPKVSVFAHEIGVITYGVRSDLVLYHLPVGRPKLRYQVRISIVSKCTVSGEETNRPLVNLRRSRVGRKRRTKRQTIRRRYHSVTRPPERGGSLGSKGTLYFDVGIEGRCSVLSRESSRQLRPRRGSHSRPTPRTQTCPRTSRAVMKRHDYDLPIVISCQMCSIPVSQECLCS